MMQLLITGSNGQLGRELQALQHQYPDWSWICTDRSSLDLTNPDSIARFFDQYEIDVCINCAAYTAVDLAESNSPAAQRINTEAVRELAQACKQQRARFIHISSDYVYHNQLNRPLRETDPTTPQNVYAQTKLAGDHAALEANPESLILRASWIYSTFGRNFVKTMLQLGKERPELRVVCDQIGAPTYARDLARIILTLIETKQVSQHSGIYNFSNEGVCSWYDFAQAIFEYSGISCAVQPITSAEFPTPAQRPAYSVLDKSLFKNTFGYPIPYWRDSLKECLRTLHELS